MAIYDHQCQDLNCNFEWEDTYSITKDPPTECPKCKQQTAKRLISLGGKGIVELYGHELVAKTKEDAAKFKKEVYSNEKTYANVLGEAKYQQLQTKMDKRKR